MPLVAKIPPPVERSEHSGGALNFSTQLKRTLCFRVSLGGALSRATYEPSAYVRSPLIDGTEIRLVLLVIGEGPTMPVTHLHVDAVFNALSQLFGVIPQPLVVDARDVQILLGAGKAATATIRALRYAG